MAISSTLELRVNTKNAQRILEIARETGALLDGEFTLASGRKSNHYFEGKRLTLSAEGAYLVGKVVFDELADIDVDAIGGLAIGADPIATAVAVVSHLEGKPIPAFIVREEPKQHGTRKKIEGHIKEGFRVVIVDDVITTGGSVDKAIEAVKEAGCKVVKVIVLVDRHEGGSDKLKEAGYDVSSIIDLWPTGKVTIGKPSAVTREVREGILPR
jgi:orotate phosphoribosyltransferase